MAKRKLSQEEKLTNMINELRKDQERWKYIDENGSGDPGWPDGINMNLVRSHIIFGMRNIMMTCDEMEIPYPKELQESVPPKINDDYMANFSDEKRVERLKSRFNLTSRKEVEDIAPDLEA